MAVGDGGMAETGSVCAIRELDVWQAQELLDAGLCAASVAELTGRGSAVYYLRQAALESLIAERMRVRAVISVHRALLGGVSVAEIAHVTGSTCERVAGRWRDWADGQRRLNERCPGLGLGGREYDQVAAAVDRVAGDAGEDTPPAMSFTHCACPATDAQIGSPRP